MLAAEAVGKQIQNLPMFNFRGLGEELLERAMMLYSFIGQAYVWENWQINNPRNFIPANIAVPWCELAEMLSRGPILSYASYALYNWRRIEKTGQVVLGNICLLQNFYGGLDEEWFILPHVAIECEAEPAISNGIWMTDIYDEDAESVMWWLEILHKTLQKMNLVMSRIPEGCDPYIYYNRVRPFIQGWRGNPALPQGVIYEGVEKFKSRPQQFRGETGAQSTIIPCMDAFLGVSHADKLSDGSPDILKSYLLDMRNYMPRKHREFLGILEKLVKTHSLREFVLKNSGDANLLNAFNACLEELIKFSDMHYDYATRYIHKQTERGANPTETGTGGTPFMKYLKKHRDERESALIS